VKDISNSIIGNPGAWSKPEDVAKREREMRAGINEYRKQEQQDRAKANELSYSILKPQPAVLTPEPAEKPKGFAETYALYNYHPEHCFMWGCDDDGDGA